MAKTIGFHTLQRGYEARLVAGVFEKNERAASELYSLCSRYFWAKYRGVFFAKEEVAREILQNTFITLWEQIERHEIYAADGKVIGKDGEPMTCKLTSYFMGVAFNKYKEWARTHPVCTDVETEEGRAVREEGFDAGQYFDLLYDSADNTMLNIVADVISRMSDQCYKVLTKFYYEEKNLDTILQEMPTMESKNALKTKKYKCMETLRSTAKSIYRQYLNS